MVDSLFFRIFASEIKKIRNMAKVTNINWETDGEDVSLPMEVELPSDIEEDDYDAIDNYLSDTYGWLVNDYSVEV